MQYCPGVRCTIRSNRLTKYPSWKSLASELLSKIPTVDEADTSYSKREINRHIKGSRSFVLKTTDLSRHDQMMAGYVDQIALFKYQAMINK